MHNPNPSSQPTPSQWPDPPPSPEVLYRPAYYIQPASSAVTYTLIGINLVMFALMIGYGVWRYQEWNGSEDGRVLLFLGAKVNPLIALGQYWRLFTAMFLHIGVAHIILNLFSLYSLGTLAESYFGHVRFALVYLIGGLFGSLASYALSNSLSAGASGAIFALAGAITVYFLIYRENFGTRGRSILQNMLVVIALNLAFGFRPGSGIDNWAHLGGLLGGALAAWGILPRYESPGLMRPGPQPLRVKNRLLIETLWVLLCFILLALGVYWRTNLYLST